jgi:hypothetical protein
MEKNVPTAVTNGVLAYEDALYPAYGWGRLMANAPVIMPDRKAHALSSAPDSYERDTQLGYGNRSGLYNVVTVNQAAIATGMIALLEDVLHIHEENPLAYLDHGDRLLQLSKTDDNLLVLIDEKDYEILRDKKYVIANLPVEFESETDRAEGDTGTFLAYKYQILREGDTFQVSNWKTKDSQIFKRVLSEGGLYFEDEQQQWLRVAPKGSAMPPGLGYLLSFLDYADHESAREIDNVLCSLLHKHFKMRWYDAWPVEKDMVLNIANTIETDKLEDLAPFIIENWGARDWLYKFNSVLVKLTEDDKRKYFLHVNSALLQKLAPGIFKTESADDEPRQFTYPDRNVTLASEIIGSKLDEMR